MSISYASIRKECYLRSAQLAGTDQASLETAYVAATLDGAEVPSASFKAQIINIEADLSQIIASDASHPYRTYIYGASADLANLASTPQSDADDNPFIGVFDSVMDSATNRPLTVQPTETLTDYEDAFFADTELWNYAMVGQTIQHTRTAVNLQGCIFNRTTRETAYDADGNSPLPPVLSTTWIAGVMANLPQVGWSDAAGASQMYGQIYQQGIAMLRSGTAQQVNLPLSSQNQVAG